MSMIIGPGNLHLETWFPRPLEEVFEFFSNAGNLAELTPDWVHFKIETPGQIEMKAGTLIAYKLRIRGFPVRWVTQITEWNPPWSFADVQLKGPYKIWEHRHTFAAEDGGTRMIDEVRYQAPGGTLIEKWLVRPDLKRIFDYRTRKMQELFGVR